MIQPLTNQTARVSLSGNWLALPANLSDARQRGLPTEPFVAYLVMDNVAPFDQVALRTDGLNFWFDGIDTHALPWRAEQQRKQLDDMTEKPKGTSPEEALAYAISLEQERIKRMPSEEREMRHHLGLLGAALVSYQPLQRGEGYMIRYRSQSDGERTVTISTDFRVLSAGVCLAGGDENFDLASIVGVLREARQQGRND